MTTLEAWARQSGDALLIDELKADIDRKREIIREQGEFIQKLKRDIRDFLNHPSLG